MHVQAQANDKSPGQVVKIKKDKHGKHCNYQQKHFSPFVISLDILLDREALVLLSRLSRFIAEKR